MDIEFSALDFNSLRGLQVYQVLQLREAVFMIEQNCVYKDIDDKDLKSIHIMGYVENQLVAYCRVMDAGVKYSDAASIGRVCTHIDYRKRGIGIALMKRAMMECEIQFANTSKITISAQCYLEKFYQNLGFISTSKMYLEDDIPHVEMYTGLNH
jgi:ElaA protein